MPKSRASIQAPSDEHQASKEDLDRILEIGRILMSVLSEEEKKELALLLSQDATVGNTGVT